MKNSGLRQKLIKQKKIGLLTVVLSLILGVLGMISYTEADKQLMKLDSMRLDEVVLGE
tara:strand:+ start:3426 stop:3599 length:174 start_codon:yes stop_codon:yes gene_type:complete